MVETVLCAEKRCTITTTSSARYSGPDVRVEWRNVANLSQLKARDCAEIDGLMVMRHVVAAEHFAKFPTPFASCGRP